MEAFTELFNNSIFQSIILSPLMGVIFAVLFAGLTKAPPSNVPVTVVRTKEIYVTRIIHRRSSSNDDGRGVLGLLVVGLLFILWKYVVLVEEIQFYIAVSLLTSFSFSFTAILISFFKGQFTSEEWGLYIISPLAILLICMFLLNLAHTSFDSRLIQGALENNYFQFYFSWLSSYGRTYLIFHVFGVIALCAVILFTSLALLHYLSLMNQRSGGSMHNFWLFFVRITMFFSGRGWLFLSVFLLIFSYLAIEPTYLTKWVM